MSNVRSARIHRCLAEAAQRYGGKARLAHEWCVLIDEIRDEALLAGVESRGIGVVFGALHRNGRSLPGGLQIRRGGLHAPHTWEIVDERGQPVSPSFTAPPGVEAPEPAPGPSEAAQEPVQASLPLTAGPPRVEGLTAVCSQEHSLYLDGATLVRVLQMIGYAIPDDAATVTATARGAGDPQQMSRVLEDLKIRVSWSSLHTPTQSQIGE